MTQNWHEQIKTLLTNKCEHFQWKYWQNGKNTKNLRREVKTPKKNQMEIVEFF